MGAWPSNESFLGHWVPMSRRAQRDAGPPDGVPVEPEEHLPTGDDGDASVDAAYQLKEIGEGLRWYDAPFLALQWLQRSRLFGFAPARWRGAIRDGVNTLYQTHYARELRHSPREQRWDQINIPEGESVSMPAVWITEYFTASGVQRLYKKILAAGWDEPRFQGFAPGGVRSVLSSRGGGGRRGGEWLRWSRAGLGAEIALSRFDPACLRACMTSS